MKTLTYKITVELNPQNVTAKNLTSSEDEILSMFERVVGSHKMNRAGMFLRVVSVTKERAGGGSEKSDESWQSFRESLKEEKLQFQSDLSIRIDIQGEGATEQGAETIINQIVSTVEKLGMDGKSGTVKIQIIGKGPLRKTQGQDDEQKVKEAIQRKAL